MFTGKELDQETGLYYFGARYLDPQVNRWMSVDPKGFELINPMEKNQKGELVAKKRYSVIESTNWYSYCSNNPVKYVDPNGKVSQYAVNNVVNLVYVDVSIYVSNFSDVPLDEIKQTITDAWTNNGEGWKFTDTQTGEEYALVINLNFTDDPDEALSMSTPNQAIIYNPEDLLEVSHVEKGAKARMSTEPQRLIHETGHIIGLGDQYTRDEKGNVIINQGWTGNIMGDENGIVDQRNIDLLGQTILDKSRDSGNNYGYLWSPGSE